MPLRPVRAVVDLVCSDGDSGPTEGARSDRVVVSVNSSVVRPWTGPMKSLDRDAVDLGRLTVVSDGSWAAVFRALVTGSSGSVAAGVPAPDRPAAGFRVGLTDFSRLLVSELLVARLVAELLGRSEVVVDSVVVDG